MDEELQLGSRLNPFAEGRAPRVAEHADYCQAGAAERRRLTSLYPEPLAHTLEQAGKVSEPPRRQCRVRPGPLRAGVLGRSACASSSNPKDRRIGGFDA